MIGLPKVRYEGGSKSHSMIHSRSRERFWIRLHCRGRGFERSTYVQQLCEALYYHFSIKYKIKQTALRLALVLDSDLLDPEFPRAEYRTLRFAWLGSSFALYWWWRPPEAMYEADWLPVIIKTSIKTPGAADVCSVQVPRVLYSYISWGVQFHILSYFYGMFKNRISILKSGFWISIVQQNPSRTKISLHRNPKTDFVFYWEIRKSKAPYSSLTATCRKVPLTNWILRVVHLWRQLFALNNTVCTSLLSPHPSPLLALPLSRRFQLSKHDSNSGTPHRMSEIRRRATAFNTFLTLWSPLTGVSSRLRQSAYFSIWKHQHELLLKYFAMLTFRHHGWRHFSLGNF